MNNVCLIGRITKDLELRETQEGKKVCKFTIAVRRDENNADFINCMVWNQQAENLCKYQSKGSLISVVGSIRTGSYEKEGNKVNTFEVLANQIHYLESKKEANTDTNKGFEGSSLYQDEIVLTGDDLPF